jgi:hypothetical protein
MLQRNRALGPELFDAAVRVDIDEVEGVAGPVLGDVGVGEFIAPACCSRMVSREIAAEGSEKDTYQ